MESERFAALVEESAWSIQKREETDSVPFVDDIRYFVYKLFNKHTHESHRRYELLDLVLERLNLSG